MTHNYHTPIPNGAAANADSFNNPLGEMDEALSEALLLERDGHIIQDEGVDLAQMPRVNFTGAGVTAANSGGKTVVTIPGGVTAHNALSGLSADDHPQYLLTSGLRDWDEQASNPSTPATNKWKLFFKPSGLYYIDDAGVVLGPLDPTLFLAKTGLTQWDEQSSSPSSPSASKMLLYFKNDEKLYKKNSGGTETEIGAGGGELKNYILNGSFQRFERLTTPATPVSMVDNSYNGPDAFYSLIQGSGATIAQAAGIGTSEYSCKITMGGTTNRVGIAQILKAERSIPLRGKTVTFQILAKPINNAGSGTRRYRVAILEWQGTANTIGATPHDLVSNWASGTFTLGSFFENTTKNLVGTASFTVSHGVETILSVTGAVSSSCNNIIAFWWTEDIPTHASDYVQLGEAGYFISSSAQSWRYQNDDFDCDEFCQRYGAATGTSMLAGLVDTTSILLCFLTFRRPMFAAPTFSYGSAIGDWSIRYIGGSVSVCTNLTQSTVSKWSSTHVATATGTPLTAGQAGQLRAVNANAYLLYEANL